MTDKLGNVLIQVMQDLSRISTNGSAKVKVNQHVCEPEEFQQMFNYFSRGTLLERIDLDVDPMNTRMECGCGYEEEINDPNHNGYDRCPSCGQFADVKDEKYKLVKPDPEQAGLRKSIRF